MEWLYNPWVWLIVALVTLAMCTYLPIKIKNDDMRRMVNWFILVPVSIIIIAYVYPVGIEFFRRFAVGGL